MLYFLANLLLNIFHNFIQLKFVKNFHFSFDLKSSKNQSTTKMAAKNVETKQVETLVAINEITKFMDNIKIIATLEQLQPEHAYYGGKLQKLIFCDGDTDDKRSKITLTVFNATCAKTANLIVSKIEYVLSIKS